MPTIKLRRGSSSQWNSANPILSQGEPGYDVDTGNVAVGDGKTFWSGLKRFVKIDEVTAAVQQYVTSVVVTNSSLAALADSTGYVYAILDQNGKMAFGVKPDGNVVAKFQLTDGQVTDAALSPSITQRLMPSGIAGSSLPVTNLGTSPVGDSALAWTDATGRIAMQINSDGSVSISKLLLKDASVALRNLGPDVSLPSSVPLASGVGFAISDTNGRLSELVVDEAGKIPLNVLQRWAQRMIESGYIVIPSVVDPLAVVIPSQTYEVAGSLHKYRYSAILKGLSADHRIGAAISGYTFVDASEGTYADSLRVKPAAAQTRTATLTIKDRARATVSTATTSVIVSAPSTPTALRLMAIGDSITRPNYYNGKVATILGGSTVGTRTYDNVICGEGRGGWSLDAYRNRFIHPSFGDSPFLFPTGVAGDKYKGNVQWWAQVVSTAGQSSYDHQGFQKIARGWNNTGPYLYGVDGYPLSPTEGDVVVDPSFASGAQVRQFVTGSWQAMSPQPVGYELSFSKYMTRFAAAFPAGGPTCISVLLNTNDFYNSATTGDLTNWGTKMDELIASIRAWSPTVPIVPIIAPVGGPSDYWARASSGVQKHDFDGRIRDGAAYMISKWDNAASRTNKIVLASFLGVLDDTSYADNLHPIEPTGHDQFAPHLAGAVAYAMGL